MGKAAQVVINERYQVIKGGGVAAAPFDEQLSHILREFFGHFGSRQRLGSLVRGTCMQARPLFNIPRNSKWDPGLSSRTRSSCSIHPFADPR